LAEIGSFPQKAAVRGSRICDILDAGARPTFSKWMHRPDTAGLLSITKWGTAGWEWRKEVVEGHIALLFCG
jgi:hypothetical protein